MSRIKELKKEIRSMEPLLRKRFHIKEIGVFGSFVRGEESSQSDLDVLVSFLEPIGLFDFVKLENFLSDRLGVKVDLVMKDSLKPRIRDVILDSTEYI